MYRVDGQNVFPSFPKMWSPCHYLEHIVQAICFSRTLLHKLWLIKKQTSLQNVRNKTRHVLYKKYCISCCSPSTFQNWFTLYVYLYLKQILHLVSLGELYSVLFRFLKCFFVAQTTSTLSKIHNIAFNCIHFCFSVSKNTQRNFQASFNEL